MTFTLFYTISIYLILMPVAFGFLSTFFSNNRGKNRKWYIWVMAFLWPLTTIIAIGMAVVFAIMVLVVKICDVVRALVQLGEDLGN